MLPYGSPAGLPSPFTKSRLNPPARVPSVGTLNHLRARHVPALLPQWNLGVVHQHLHYALDLADPQQHLKVRQIAIVPCKPPRAA